MTSNTVAFPTPSRAVTPSVSSETSLQARHPVVSMSCHTSAVEVCDLVYSASISSWDAIERFYEPNATYENPFVTASSRTLISDIHAVASHLSHIDVPRPVAVLHALFGLKKEKLWMSPWFRAVSVWGETGDVCESESFDGHRKIIVEHTLHILLLPGLHSPGRHHQVVATTQPETPSTRTLSLPSAHLQQVAHYSTLGIDLSLPSPFHLRLPITSKLSFNDAGKITYHRDLWDVKDMLGLVPGMSLAQWLSGRFAAQGIRGVAWLGRSLLWSRPEDEVHPRSVTCRKRTADEEQGLSSAGAYANAVREETT
ncbi:uncharacterized protein PHACADRAFT_250032 [Phanerochaete carnosa HHB-10118-sp]|uniref:Uncharacterized protein n=1 Tax=Phanerochaete carnosa (strain HHB-10118-sp) TaxID=650164 RepID=K5V9I7_PHACS|nr:uncharacterized protein PHACADRAFT_250032 [Phanerochaete carnosa HHB-10118-sp]EKM59496.1 hypothetical protein PHACADRAFT_250032 [Phanerochaete carnosa HHB-10118-sp]